MPLACAVWIRGGFRFFDVVGSCASALLLLASSACSGAASDLDAAPTGGVTSPPTRLASSPALPPDGSKMTPVDVSPVGTVGCVVEPLDAGTDYERSFDRVDATGRVVAVVGEWVEATGFTVTRDDEFRYDALGRTHDDFCLSYPSPR